MDTTADSEGQVSATSVLFNDFEWEPAYRSSRSHIMRGVFLTLTTTVIMSAAMAYGLGWIAGTIITGVLTR